MFDVDVLKWTNLLKTRNDSYYKNISATANYLVNANTAVEKYIHNLETMSKVILRVFDQALERVEKLDQNNAIQRRTNAIDIESMILDKLHQLGLFSTTSIPRYASFDDPQVPVSADTSLNVDLKAKIFKLLESLRRLQTPDINQLKITDTTNKAAELVKAVQMGCLVHLEKQVQKAGYLHEKLSDDLDDTRAMVSLSSDKEAESIMQEHMLIAIEQLKKYADRRRIQLEYLKS